MQGKKHNGEIMYSLELICRELKSRLDHHHDGGGAGGNFIMAKDTGTQQGQWEDVAFSGIEIKA